MTAPTVASGRMVAVATGSSGLPVHGVTDVAWVAAAGALAGVGVLLAITGLLPRRAGASAAASRRVRAWRRQTATTTRRWSRQALVASSAALAVVVLTRWLVAGLAAAAVALLWRRLVGSAVRELQVVDRLEGLAAWIESLRDSPATARGLDEAVLATAYAAPPAIAGPVRRLADLVGAGDRLTDALTELAAELDDSSADLAVGGLLLAADLRGRELRDVLAALAVAVREGSYVARRAAAGRRSTRRGLQGVLGGATAFAVGLALVNRSYVEPYGTPTGQVVLLAVVGLVGVGALWLRRLATRQPPARLVAAGVGPAAGATAGVAVGVAVGVANRGGSGAR